MRTARALDEATADLVRQSLTEVTGKTVVVEFQVDPTLIGGMVAKVGDTVYDASVRARLDAIQNLLIRSPGATVAEA